MNATLPSKGSTDPCAHLATLPDEAVVNADEFAAMAACSVRHLERLVSRGEAPKPVAALGSRPRRWRVGDIRAWLRGVPHGA